jgi:hypothetical protein
MLLGLMATTTTYAQVPTKPGYLSRWTSFTTETAEGNPAAVVVDMGLQSVAPAEGYLYQGSFLIRFLKPDSTGLEELKNPEVLWQIEDKLSTSIGRTGGLYFAMVTAEGYRDYYFYLTDTIAFKQICKTIMTDFPTYIHQTQVELDPYWFNYFGVFPDEYTLQIQYNEQKMEELLASGDSLTTPRMVEHFSNFRTERDRDSFEKEVGWLGYHILGKGENDGELKYGIIITKKHAVDRENVEPISLQLIDITMKHAGYYDGWECEPLVPKTKKQ